MFVIILCLIILFILYPKESILHSDSILGKCIAILLITWFTYKNVMVGLFTCVLIIWFYQSDFLQRYQYLHSETFTPIYPQNVYDNKENIILSNNESKLEKYNDAYPKDLKYMTTEADTVFRNQHCSKDLELMYKESKILHSETVSSIFPEISFANDIPCNPCDITCKIVVNKIDNEKELMPKYSKNNSDMSVLEWAFRWLPQKSEPFQGVDNNVASYFH
jgi:hypothetical protein